MLNNYSTYSNRLTFPTFAETFGAQFRRLLPGQPESAYTLQMLSQKRMNPTPDKLVENASSPKVIYTQHIPNIL
jgi:hypothetical protein